MRSTSPRYSLVAMILHWILAVLLLWNIWLAWQFEDLHGPAKLALMQTHKALGITILLLSLIRLGWRLMNPAPEMGAPLKVWERRLGLTVHWAFYVVMIAMPLTGWAMVSASTRIKTFPISMFGLFDWPAISPLTNLPPAQMHQVHELFEVAHADVLKIIVYILIVLHIAGALKHQFLDRDGELGRMVPFLRAPGRKD